MNQLPVVGPISAQSLRDYLAHPEPPYATEEWIETQLALLSIKAQRNRSSIEADLVVEVYMSKMLDFSRVDLAYAIDRLVTEEEFFPDISKIVALAQFSKGQRNVKRVQAQMLISKHEREWTPPIPESELCRPEDVALILNELRVGSQKVSEV